MKGKLFLYRLLREFGNGRIQSAYKVLRGFPMMLEPHYWKPIRHA